MKTICVVVFIAAIALAEPPPSNSYLPPSSSSRNAGYPQGPAGANPLPQVIAARNFAASTNSHEHVSGGARNTPHDHTQAKIGQAQGYDENSADFARNAIDVNSEPANYNFGYMVSDFSEGTDFGHREERVEERAQGEYHVVLPDGRKQTVSYEADERGFKPQISYEDSEELSRSNGYDSNANSQNNGNGYDSNANSRNNVNGYKSGQDARSGY